jgi:hypothetical protein
MLLQSILSAPGGDKMGAEQGPQWVGPSGAASKELASNWKNIIGD